jgi:hypothetical protein
VIGVVAALKEGVIDVAAVCDGGREGRESVTGTTTTTTRLGAEAIYNPPPHSGVSGVWRPPKAAHSAATTVHSP